MIDLFLSHYVTLSCNKSCTFNICVNKPPVPEKELITIIQGIPKKCIIRNLTISASKSLYVIKTTNSNTYITKSIQLASIQAFTAL